MYLLNNNRQQTEDAKGELSDTTYNFIFCHVSKIKHCTIQGYYIIKLRRGLCTLARNQLTRVKSRYAPERKLS